MVMRPPARAGSRSYLLCVTAARSAARYVVQDLRTGERHRFGSPRELQAFLAAQGRARLR